MQVIVDSKKLEVIDIKTLEVCLVGGKAERLEDVARIGTESGWMVIEFTDGRQKVYSPYNVVSIEEIAQMQKKKAVS